MKNLLQKIIFTILTAFVFLFNTHAQQPAFNANTVVPPYSSNFYFGSNPGYYGGFNNNAPNDELIHDLFIKAGMHTTRPALYDYFLDQYGVNARKTEFAYYTATLNMKELTLFLNGPSDAHQSTKMIHCVNANTNVTEQFRSQVFKNLYAPIWDDSTNGLTPVNDTNYYAAYVYKIVKNYGSYIRFYEVWNEPDFAANANVSLNPGQPGNWWDTNPSPCDLVNLRDEITNYVRMLRITYEVVKSMQPESYIATGGLGYTNFLDAVMRNTDNPVDGSVTTAYPLKGGAYFDVLSYHSYPQYNLREWNNNINGFTYFRHSDFAVQQVIDLKNSFQTILTKYGYNGSTYPAKYFILTEVNIPRRHYGTTDYIGTPEAQRNFLMKMFVIAQKQGIKQVYTYNIGDSKDETDPTVNTDGFDGMGFYYNLNKATPSTATLVPSGVGCKSLSDFIFGYTFDAAATTALNLPSTADGAAFTKGTETRYVLWAKTQTDQSEVASVIYTFPTALNFHNLTTKSWDYSSSGTSQTKTGSTLTLSGTPILITGNTIATGILSSITTADWFTIYPNPTNENVTIRLLENSSKSVLVHIYDLQGKVVQTVQLNSETNTTIILNTLTSGVYEVEVFSEENGKASKKLIVY
jgi:hypothetical protein